MALHIRQLLLGPLQNFVYLIADENTRDAIVIDPGWDPLAIAKAAKEEEMKLRGILVTHTHFDHINAVPPMVKDFDIPVWVHQKEIGDLPVKPSSVKTFVGGDLIQVGGLDIKVLHTPGHTTGSSCFEMQDLLLTGDTLFVKACGRSDLEGGNPEELWKSLGEIAKLDDNLVVYPGHDYGDTPQSTVAEERRANPFMQFHTPQEFVRRVTGHI